MKTPLCDICYKGESEGLRLFHIGDSAPGVPVFRCKAHRGIPYSPPIDIEARVIIEDVTPTTVTAQPAAPAP